MESQMLLEIDQEEIDWTPGNSPRLSGKINHKPWSASFVFGHTWSIHRHFGDSLTKQEIQHIKLFLDQQTPPFTKRVKDGKTKIPKSVILGLIGIGAAATVLILTQKHRRKTQRLAKT